MTSSDPMSNSQEPFVDKGKTDAPRKLRILTFTTLYPNAAQPTHGVFVENRIRHLHLSGSAEIRIVAPVPYFPSKSERFGAYAQFAQAPKVEDRHGLHIDHPRYLLLPKISMLAAPFSLYAAGKRMFAQIQREGYDFDLIDAHYLYPDGIAAMLLGRTFRRPVVITARGTDVNLIPRYRLPRRMILWAARNAAALITVSAALKDALVELGVSPEKVHVLRNGVDLKLFSPQDRAVARAAFGAKRLTLLSVGHLIKRKGHDLIIEALPMLPDCDLLIAGDGEEREALAALVARLGLENRVTFLGRLAHENLPQAYSAADILVLASDREGWPNVLLEAMACGTPAVASRVWGNPEVVASPDAGELFDERRPEAIAAAVTRLLARNPSREATRRYAEYFSWDATTQGQLELFNKVIANRKNDHV